jgi:hypothetical protein
MTSEEATLYYLTNFNNGFLKQKNVPFIGRSSTISNGYLSPTQTKGRAEAYLEVETTLALSARS